MANPCTECGAPGIPGLLKGNGKCQRHWTAGVWGPAWATELYGESAMPTLGLNDIVDRHQLDFGKHPAAVKATFRLIWDRMTAGPNSIEVQRAVDLVATHFQIREPPDALRT